MIFDENSFGNVSSGRGGKKGAVQTCTTCKGSGFVVRVNQIAPGMIQQIRAHCSDCDGQGEKINPKDKCKACDGKKILPERKIIEVHIDKGSIEFQRLIAYRSKLIFVCDVLGMEDGRKIVFSNEGDQEPGMEPGDIIIVLDEKEHPTFKRDKTDLHMKMQITLTEALCGFQKAIKTLDNRQLVITSLPGISFFKEKTKNFYSMSIFFIQVKSLNLEI